MRHAVALYSASASTSLELQTVYEDAFMHYCIANGIGPLVDAFELNTDYLREELHTNFASHVTIVGVFIGLALLVMAGTCLLSVRPTVMHIEASKTQVLAIFLSIPSPIRRSLRRKTMSVYKLTRRAAQEQETLAAAQEAEDQKSASVHGSEATFHSSMTGSSLSSHAKAQNDAYAAVFKRYQELRGRKADESPRSRNSRAQHAIDHAREADTDADTAADAPATALDQGHSVNAAPAVDIAIDLAAATQLAVEEADANEAVNAESQSGRSIYARRALIRVVTRFSFFIVVVTAYFTFLSVYTSSVNARVEEQTLITSLAHRRSTHIQLALMNALYHTLYNYDSLVVSEPVNPMLGAGSFDTAGMAQLDELETLHHAVLYGNATMGVPMLGTGDQQEALLYSSICDLDADTATAAYPDWTRYPYIADECESYQAGLMTRGLSGMITRFVDDLSFILQPGHSTLFIRYAFGLPIAPYSAAYCEALLQRFQDVNELASDYLVKLLAVSDGLYGLSAAAFITDLEEVELLLLLALIAFVLLTYFLVLRPLTTTLFLSNAETKAMMLLAPAEILRHVQVAQDYIQEFISSE
jgi:hypothetical protein